MKNAYKTFLLVSIFLTFNNQTIGQICTQEIFQELISADTDSLEKQLNLILKVNKLEDMPYYEEFRFSKQHQPTYFYIQKTSENTALGYRVTDAEGKDINTTLLSDEQHHLLIKLDPDYTGEYTFILYSKNPDNSCVLLMKLHKDDRKKYIKTPNITIGSTDKGELLKQYHLKIDKPEIPYVYKTAYVLKKEHTYYFHWKNNKNLRLKVFDANKNEIELKTTNNTPTLDCTETGLYYFTVYQKEPLNQSATLSLYKAE